MKQNPQTPTQADVLEYLPLLSVGEPECVSTHPILKCVDFALPIEDVDFSTIAHASRFLASLRLCRKFLHGLAFIRLQMAALNGPAVLEAARLLADAQIHSRYTSGDQTEINETAVVELSRQLSERVSTSWLPTAMRTTVNTLLGCVVDPARTVAEFRPDEMKHVIFRSELHESLAMAALYSENWDVFRLVMSSCPLSPNHSPMMVFHLINFVLRNSEKRSKVLEWYLKALSLERAPLSATQWSKYAANVIRVCGSTPEMVTVTNSGRVVPSSGESGFSLPNEEPFREQDFLSLKSSLNGLLNELSKGSGSVTRKEVAAMRQSIRSWSKADGERAVVIDSLNVFHGSANGITALVSLANRLSAEYSNAVIVTRPFLAEKLKSVRWRGRVRVFACTSLSEDDLLLLLAAVEWGPNAYVLSNDRFGIHMERASRSGGLLLKEWMRRRILRFSRQNWHYDSLPKYGEFVQLIAAGVYFVPVSEETPEIPQRSAYLVPIS